MSAVQAGRPWTTRAGWGIVADLTPPELVASRRLKVLRRQIVAGLVILLLLCGGGYQFAQQRHTAAESAFAEAQSRTAQLQTSAHRYAGITKIQGTTRQVRTQLTTLMAGDVELYALLGRLHACLPKTMTIQQESVIISLASVATPVGAAAGLDTSGRAQIGKVTLSGSARTLDDLSAFVDKLTTVAGVVDVVPTSNVSDRAGVQYSLALTITDELRSHRFDKVAPKGGS